MPFAATPSCSALYETRDAWTYSSPDRQQSNRRRRRRRPSRRRPPPPDYIDDNNDDGIDDENDDYWEANAPLPPPRRQRDFGDPYADEFYDETDERYYDFDDEQFDDEEEEGYYYEADPPYPPPPRVEWEEVVVPPLSRNSDLDSESTAFVLLPPSPPTMHPLPRAVLHFVGGTWFGSAPQIFYRSLLEDIVLHTQCAIVVTPLPVITPLSRRNPLHHINLARQLQHQFQYAYDVVLEDEYGSTPMATVPIAGLGHSLGSRLLVVLATLMNDKSGSTSVRKKKRRAGIDANYKYNSMILISFTNFEAAAGIPGVSTLTKERQRLNNNDLESKKKASAKQKNRQDQKDEDEDRPRRRRRRPRRNRRRGYYDDDDEYDMDWQDEEEQDWAELWSEFQGVVRAQADRIKGRVTPHEQDLEFYPTPRQLWHALEGQRYQVPQTLLVQFDRDDMDQSAKLATILTKNNDKIATESGLNSTAVPDDGDDSIDKSSNNTATPPSALHKMDLKFARLRGTHLTPVTTDDKQRKRDEEQEQGIFQQWSSKTTKAVWNAVQGRVVGVKPDGSRMSQEEALLDLRQTITRYIADVVTK